VITIIYTMPVKGFLRESHGSQPPKRGTDGPWKEVKIDSLVKTP